ncbi:MAG: hypothetical protein WAM80_12800 [Candidatus Acidiferrales bacterium]
MTICIAAITSELKLIPYEDLIVVASDPKVSFGSHSAENTIKAESVHECWGIMFAANDITQATPVIDRVRELLQGQQGTLQQLKSAFKKAYQEQVREIVSDTLLSPFGMSLDDFRKKGSKQLPAQTCLSIAQQIRDFDFGCQFLGYGFDPQKRPHIITVDNPGNISVWDKPGFCAIGSGSPAALTVFSLMGQAAEKTTFQETIYNVLAAKYMSEGADGVGKETFFFVKKYKSAAMMMSLKVEPEMRKLWESRGRPKLPGEIAELKELIRRANIRFLVNGKEETIKY